MTNTKRKITRAPAVLSKGHGVQNETDYLLCLALDVMSIIEGIKAKRMNDDDGDIADEV